MIQPVMINISVIIPLLSKEENTKPLYENSMDVLASLDSVYDISSVDSGSSDNSLTNLTQVTAVNL